MSDEWRKYVVPEPSRFRPPRVRRGIYSYGPEALHLRENIQYGGGPEQFVRNNPGLFATGTTSRDEGFFYWALIHLIGPEREPGKNGMVWYYQSKVGPNGRAGSAIVDFTVERSLDQYDLGIRIVTPRFHIQAGAGRRAIDNEQVYMLLRQGFFVVDVFSQNYTSDKTGRAVMAVAQKAIEAQPDFSPLHRRWRRE